MDGRDFLGRRIRVELAKGDREKFSGRDRRSNGYHGRRSPPRSNGFYGRPSWTGPPGRTPRTPWRVIVDNISSRTSWQELKDYFRAAGDVNYCTANKLSYGVGMVEFVDRRGMENAIDKFDKSEIDGKVIRVEEERRVDRGRSRSRSPAHRRSKSPANRRSRSRDDRRSRSPDDRRSRSRSTKRSPVNRKSSRSPTERKSRSPVNRRSRTPVRSRSPVRRRSRTPENRRSRSPIKREQRSPRDRRSRS